MNQRTLKKGCAVILAAYLAIAALFYWVGGDQLQYRDNQTDILTPSGVINEITDGMVVEQQIEVDGDLLLAVNLVGAP